MNKTVGVNDFVKEDEDIDIPILRIDEKVYNNQVQKQINDNTDGIIKLAWIDSSFTNAFTGGKLGTVTFTPAAGATSDNSLTITGYVAGGEEGGTLQTSSGFSINNTTFV